MIDDIPKCNKRYQSRYCPDNTIHVFDKKISFGLNPIKKSYIAVKDQECRRNNTYNKNEYRSQIECKYLVGSKSNPQQNIIRDRKNI